MKSWIHLSVQIFRLCFVITGIIINVNIIISLLSLFLFCFVFTVISSFVFIDITTALDLVYAKNE